jgi:hypothetical protein
MQLLLHAGNSEVAALQLVGNALTTNTNSTQAIAAPLRYPNRMLSLFGHKYGCAMLGQSLSNM